jgi:multidrug efflux pump
MTIFEQFIRRPVGTIMLNTALLVFGILGLMRLPVRELPNVDPPTVNVLTVLPGASAEVVETEVTEQIEEAISSCEGIKLLTSQSREQVSSIAVEFIQERNLDLAAQDVRDRVARIRGQLPDDIEEPVISKQDAAAQPIMWIAFFSDRLDTRELTRIAEDQVKDRLQTVPGVSSVIIGGEKRLAIRLWLDSEKMAARQVTVQDIDQALQEQNVELPSGRVENIDREFTIQTRGELKTPDEFKRLILRQSGTDVVRLGDVGWAEYGVEDLRGIARFNSRPSVGLGVVRQSKANTLSVAEAIKQQMDAIAPSLPEGIFYEFPYDESIYVASAVHEVWQTLALAFVLVVVTIFVFLRNLRSTFIPALAIPVSLGATFGVLFLMGYSINIFTLLALVLAIGIVVDDAIVVLENIYRHVEDGMSPFDAAVQAMKEISFAVVATTLSLVAVFVPLVFLGGLTGRLLTEFAVALAGAVVISSVVALTLSPMAGARLLKPIANVQHGKLFLFFERGFDRLTDRYRRGLQWSLVHRPTMIILALASLGMAYVLWSRLDSEFLPQEDKRRMIAMVRTPQGSTPEYTDRMVQKFEAIMAETPETLSYFTATALPFNGPGDPTFGISFVRYKDEGRHIRDIVGGPAGLGGRLFGEIEGAIAFPVLPKAVDLSFGQPFALVIRHPDLDELHQAVNRVNNALRTEGFLANVRSSFEMNKPELRVKIDRARAGPLGVSIRDLARTLQVLFGGEDLSDIKLGGKQYEVIAQLAREHRLRPSDLDQLFVRGRNGNLVQVSNLISLETGAGPNEIQRFERHRSATIEGTPAGVTLGQAMERTEQVLAKVLPPGFDYDWQGDTRNLNESSHDLYLFMALAILIVYMVLAAQFESFVHPFTVMLALPLAFLGAFGLLYILGWVDVLGNSLYGWSHYSPDPPSIAGVLSSLVPRIPSMNMNIFSQVGLILLIGLVTKNSILLVEFANQFVAKGHSAREAMLQAGQLRLRPILMTSVSTIAGILPIAIGFGDAAESRRPLGVVCVGGIFTSTILTLFVIPVMYTVFSEWALKLTGRPAGVHRYGPESHLETGKEAGDE